MALLKKPVTGTLLSRPAGTALAKPGVNPGGFKPLATRPIARPSSDPFGGPSVDPTLVQPEGFVRSDQINAENARNREVRMATPYPFRMSVGEKGSDMQDGVRIVITDTARAAKQGMPYDKIKNSPFFCYMHHWGYEEKKYQSEVCIRDGSEGCPLCARLGKEGSWEMMLTCIDSRPYTPKSGPNAGKTVPISRKLYQVKTGVQPQFQRLWMQHHTYRGMVLRCFRDNSRSPSAGSTVQFERMMSEAELTALANKFKSKELITPTNYEVAFRRPTHADLVKRFGGTGAGAMLGAADSQTDAGVSGDDIPF
jgi:hypothetical protein